MDLFDPGVKHCRFLHQGRNPYLPEKGDAGGIVL